MYGFFKMLTSEADVKLTDRTNYAFNKLSSKTHRISSCDVSFHPPKDGDQWGVVEFKHVDAVPIRAFFTIYIKQGTVYATLYTLEKIMLIDTPYRAFMSELKGYVLNDQISLMN